MEKNTNPLAISHVCISFVYSALFLEFSFKNILNKLLQSKIHVKTTTEVSKSIPIDISFFLISENPIYVLTIKSLFYTHIKIKGVLSFTCNAKFKNKNVTIEI